MVAALIIGGHIPYGCTSAGGKSWLGRCQFADRFLGH